MLSPCCKARSPPGLNSCDLSPTRANSSLFIRGLNRLAAVRFRTFQTMFEPEPNILFGVRSNQTIEPEPEWRFRFGVRMNMNIQFRTEHSEGAFKTCFFFLHITSKSYINTCYINSLPGSHLSLCELITTSAYIICL